MDDINSIYNYLDNFSNNLLKQHKELLELQERIKDMDRIKEQFYKLDNINNSDINYDSNNDSDNDVELQRVLEISRNEYFSCSNNYKNKNTNTNTNTNTSIKSEKEISEYEPNGIKYPYAKFYYYKCDKYFYGKHDHSVNCDCNQDYTEEERKKINKMKCMFCDTIQDINKKCIKCKKELANYYCKKCNILSNYPTILHCDKCNVCKGSHIPNKKIIHCNTCNTCTYEHHDCEIIKKEDTECVICQRSNKDDAPYGKYENNRRLHKLNCCGNVFHYNCLKELQNHGRNTCPLCRKSYSIN